jgi:hypothetical protein
MDLAGSSSPLAPARPSITFVGVSAIFMTFRRAVASEPHHHALEALDEQHRARR